MKTINQLLISLLTLGFLAACSPQSEQQEMLHKAVAIESADECHLCGMIISNFSGPKGEAVRKEKGSKVNKFCSTRDMFSYYLEPENKRNVAALFVHDMSKMPWDELNDGHFIDAKTAWYVAGSEKYGAMGETLASFSKKVDAEAFAKAFGGKVISFEQVDHSVLM